MPLPPGRAAGSEPEPELAADLLAEPATCKVVARYRPALRLPEHTLVERGGLVEQRVEPLAPLALRVELGGRLLVLELDAEAVGEPLDRADEVEVLGLSTNEIASPPSPQPKQ